jgi:hypothetical protein
MIESQYFVNARRYVFASPGATASDRRVVARNAVVRLGTPAKRMVLYPLSWRAH